MQLTLTTGGGVISCRYAMPQAPTYQPLPNTGRHSELLIVCPAITHSRRTSIGGRIHSMTTPLFRVSENPMERLSDAFFPAFLLVGAPSKQPGHAGVTTGTPRLEAWLPCRTHNVRASVFIASAFHPLA